MKRLLAVTVSLLLHSVAAVAADYPDRTLTIVSPFGPGTASDTVIRLLGTRLSITLNVPVVVDNRPGANGIIGTVRGVKSAPDGYTLILTTGTTVAQNPWLFKDVQYDPLRDLTGIAVLGGFPLSIVVSHDSPYHTVNDLMQAIRNNPAGINYATAYGMQTVCGELLGKAANGKVLGIPYKSTPPAVMDVTSGRVAFACAETATTLGAIVGGSLRALVVLDPAGSRYIKGVPSIQSTVPEFPVMQSWIGLAGPPGISGDKVQLLSKAIYKIASDPSFAASLSVLGYESTPMDASRTTQFMKEEYVRWRDLIKQVDIQPQ